MGHGGNSHQRKMSRKKDERLAEEIASKVLEGFEVKSAASGTAPADKKEVVPDRGKPWAFFNSTPVWGVMSLLFGGVTSHISLKITLAGALVIVFVAFRQYGLFDQRITKWVGNSAAAFMLAVVFLIVAPKLKDPLTVDQQIAERFPWLSHPPQASNPQAAPVQVTLRSAGWSLKTLGRLSNDEICQAAKSLSQSLAQENKDVTERETRFYQQGERSAMLRDEAARKDWEREQSHYRDDFEATNYQYFTQANYIYDTILEKLQRPKEIRPEKLFHFPEDFEYGSLYSSVNTFDTVRNQLCHEK
jgi:hypothetical protein